MQIKKQRILPAQQPPQIRTPTAAASPGAGSAVSVFSFAPSWERLSGCAYGIPQSVLRGNLSAAGADAKSLDAFDAWMESLLNAPLPEGAPPSGSARAVAWRALHWSIAVQRRHGIALSSKFLVEATSGNANDGSSVTRFFAAMPFVHVEASRAALDWVGLTIASFIAQGVAVRATGTLNAVDADKYETLGRVLSRFAPQGQNRPFILQHAYDTGIPVHHVVSGVWRLGTGCWGRLFDSSITDRTPSIGVNLARNKAFAAVRLRQAGVPAPVHARALDADHAVRIANQLGYPVVVKPADCEGGVGVFADLRDDALVRKSFDAARQHSKAVLVEKHFEGVGHRLSVFGGRVVKATRKLPGGVVGDGEHTVAALVALGPQQAVESPPNPDARRITLALDDEALGMLAQQGLSPDSVVAEGAFVSLRRRNNATDGGSVTVLDLDAVHPDNLRLAVRAASALGLDWAGVDLLIADAAQSWLETGALVCEVNAQPQVDRRTAGKIVDALMAGNTRIPLHLVIADAQLDPMPGGPLDRLARKLGCRAMSCAAGVWIDGERVAPAQEGGFQAAQILLADSQVESALCAMTAAEIVRHGLPVDRIDSATVIGDAPLPDAQQRTLDAAWRMLTPHLPVGSDAPATIDPALTASAATPP